MPRRRTPLAKAKIIGADTINPGRYRDRKEPSGDGSLGKPSAWMSAEMQEIWREFIAEVPWLKESDRGVVEIVCHLRQRLHAGDISSGEIGRLQVAYSACGADPVSKTRVSIDDDDDDAANEFIN